MSNFTELLKSPPTIQFVSSVMSAFFSSDQRISVNHSFRLFLVELADQDQQLVGGGLDAGGGHGNPVAEGLDVGRGFSSLYPKG